MASSGKRQALLTAARAGHKLCHIYDPALAQQVLADMGGGTQVLTEQAEEKKEQHLLADTSAPGFQLLLSLLQKVESVAVGVQRSIADHFQENLGTLNQVILCLRRHCSPNNSADRRKLLKQLQRLIIACSVMRHTSGLQLDQVRDGVQHVLGQHISHKADVPELPVQISHEADVPELPVQISHKADVPESLVQVAPEPTPKNEVIDDTSPVASAVSAGILPAQAANVNVAMVSVGCDDLFGGDMEQSMSYSCDDSAFANDTEPIQPTSADHAGDLQDLFENFAPATCSDGVAAKSSRGSLEYRGLPLPEYYGPARPWLPHPALPDLRIGSE